MRLYLYPLPHGTRTLVRGVGAGAWLKRQGIPAMRAPMTGGYDVRNERVPDLIARAEAEGIRVTLKEGQR